MHAQGKKKLGTQSEINQKAASAIHEEKNRIHLKMKHSVKERRPART